MRTGKWISILSLGGMALFLAPLWSAPEPSAPNAASEESVQAMTPETNPGAAETNPGAAEMNPGAAETNAGAAARDDEESSQRKIRELRRRAIENYDKGGARLAEARRNLLDLISLRPYVPDYHLALALVLRREGRTEEFFRKLNDVLDLNGPKQIVYLFMAEYAMQRGDRPKALAALGRAAENGMNIMEAVVHLPVLAALRTDTEFVKLSLSLERFTIRSLEFPQNFRDPFRPSNLWKKVEEGKEPQPGTMAGPNKTLDKDEQAKLLTDAKEALKTIEAYLNTPQARDAEAMDKYRELQNILAQRDHITIPRVQREFDALARKLGEIEARIQDLKLRYFWTESEKRIAEMRAAFDATEYKRVEDQYGEVKKITAEMVKANANFKPAADRITQVADHWVRRARIRAEFSKKELQILGIVTSKVDDKEGNFVILNNKLLREGQEYGGMVVDKIDRNRVTFRYQGERIGLVFRRY
jgi:hypothetical protein